MVMQGCGRFSGVNIQGLLQINGARVQSFIHLHEGNAGLAVPGHDRVLNRGGTAPARQQRGVDVDTAMSWEI